MEYRGQPQPARDLSTNSEAQLGGQSNHRTHSSSRLQSVFDDINGAKASLYGIGLDGKLSGQIWVGAEVLRRDLDSPAGTDKIVYNDWREHIYRTYLYWMINPRWAVSAEFDLEEFEQINEIRESENPKGFRIETITAPLTVQYFDPSGFFRDIGSHLHQTRCGER